MTTSSTDLRYGRRGGGWVPGKPVKEHRAPHTYTELPCPERSCAGRVRRPTVRGDSWVERCDGEFSHEWTVHRAGALVVHPDRPALDVVHRSTAAPARFDVQTTTFDASQQLVDSLAETPLLLFGELGEPET